MRRGLAIGTLLTLGLLVLVGATAIKSSDLTESVTIASGGTTSTEINMKGRCIVGIQYATMTGTALTAQCAEAPDSRDGTYVDLYDGSNSQWSLTIADDRVHDLTLTGDAICGCRWLKFVSGSSEAAERTIHVTQAG